MTSFEAEVSGIRPDQRLLTTEAMTHRFGVAAPGPLAAEVAAAQIFGDEAARRRFRATPDRTARVILDREPEPA